MHAVVTGAAGFLGSHLCEKLLSQKHKVTGIDNFITGKRQNLQPLSTNSDFKFIEADIIERIPKLKNVDRVYHLASPASPIDYIQYPFETMYVNSDGTRNALELAKSNNARFKV